MASGSVEGWRAAVEPVLKAHPRAAYAMAAAEKLAAEGVRDDPIDDATHTDVAMIGLEEFGLNFIHISSVLICLKKSTF